jgi:hypothetical protein
MSSKTQTVLLHYGGALVFTALAVLVRCLGEPLAALYGAVALAVWFHDSRERRRADPSPHAPALDTPALVITLAAAKCAAGCDNLQLPHASRWGSPGALAGPVQQG